MNIILTYLGIRRSDGLYCAQTHIITYPVKSKVLLISTESLTVIAWLKPEKKTCNKSV